MRQRDIERISGWVALGCWFVCLCLMAIFTAIALHQPPKYLPFDTVGALNDAMKDMTGQHPKPRPLTVNPAYTEWNDEVTLLLGFIALTGFAALGATKWWTWRRTQRIRIEIRAEAYDGRRRLSASRNRGTTRV